MRSSSLGHEAHPFAAPADPPRRGLFIGRLDGSTRIAGRRGPTGHLGRGRRRPRDRGPPEPSGRWSEGPEHDRRLLLVDRSETGDCYTVTFVVGWGDCPAGCINRHSWTFAVSKDGAVTIAAEQGPPVPPGTPGSDIDAGAGSSAAPTAAESSPVARASRPRHGRPHLPGRPPQRLRLRRPSARGGHDRHPDRGRQRGRPHDDRRQRLLLNDAAVGAVHDRARSRSRGWSAARRRWRSSSAKA